MSQNAFSNLIDEVHARQQLVKSYLLDENNRIAFTYKHLEDAVYSYVNAGGKALRSAVLMFCCGAVGGDEEAALPVAAAIELYHTFTLVHDDIIDHDEIRRGVPTIHFDFAQRSKNEMGFDAKTAHHYGLTIAILAGDIQQGWAASLIPDLYHKYNLPAELALNLVKELFRKTQIMLINGETIDVLQSQLPVEQLTESQVLNMLRQKTGALYEFAGRAGAAIGLRQPELNHPTVDSLAAFTGQCGIAFQLQDDILGLTGDEKELGKPIGSDIREGKRTVILLRSLPRMTHSQRDLTLKVLGDRNAAPSEVQEVIELLKSLDGVDYAKQLARRYIQDACAHLSVLQDTRYKTLLQTWADYITERTR